MGRFCPHVRAGTSADTDQPPRNGRRPTPTGGAARMFFIFAHLFLQIYGPPQLGALGNSPPHRNVTCLLAKEPWLFGFCLAPSPMPTRLTT